jgi:hypothetical protein
MKSPFRYRSAIFDKFLTGNGEFSSSYSRKNFKTIEIPKYNSKHKVITLLLLPIGSATSLSYSNSKNVDKYA